MLRNLEQFAASLRVRAFEARALILLFCVITCYRGWRTLWGSSITLGRFVSRNDVTCSRSPDEESSRPRMRRARANTANWTTTEPRPKRVAMRFTIAARHAG